MEEIRKVDSAQIEVLDSEGHSLERPAFRREAHIGGASAKLQVFQLPKWSALFFIPLLFLLLPLFLLFGVLLLVAGKRILNPKSIRGIFR